MNGIILAGGRSSRFGQNKAFIRFGDQPLIERTISILIPLFNKIYIVTNHLADYQHLNAEVVEDIFPGCGPLGGIHAGLTASDREQNFVVACDMPLLNPQLIDAFKKEADGFDLVAVKFGQRLQMLHAFYSKNCLPVIEEQLRRADLRLRELIGKVNSKIIELKDVGGSFTNINTPDDFQKVAAYAN